MLQIISMILQSTKRWLHLCSALRYKTKWFPSKNWAPINTLHCRLQLLWLMFSKLDWIVSKWSMSLIFYLSYHNFIFWCFTLQAYPLKSSTKSCDLKLILLLEINFQNQNSKMHLEQTFPRQTLTYRGGCSTLLKITVTHLTSSCVFTALSAFNLFWITVISN